MMLIKNLGRHSEGVSRPPTAGSGDGVAKGALEPNGTAPLRLLPVE
jgi:hypothetical protein